MLNTPENTLKDLKSGKFSPIYLLHGEESFYIDQIADYIEANALPESERGFNQVILYGKDITTAEILNQARRFPMMAEKQVIIIKEFQQLPDLNKEDTFKLWENYLNKPQSTTILTLCHKHKTLAKNTKLYKAMDKVATIVETKKMYENQIGTWISQFVKDKGYSIEAKAVILLVEAIGADMGRLNTELEKLILNIQPNQAINEQMIEQFVGVSKDFNVFELQRALATKNHLKSLQILNYWEANPKKQPLIPTLALLFNFFVKVMLGHQAKDKTDGGLAQVFGVAPFMVKDYRPALQNYHLGQVIQIIGFIREADLQTKGIKAGGDTDADILKELVFKILG